VTGLTQVRLKRLLHYDPETGVFTWLRGQPGLRGCEAGGLWRGHNQTYWVIGIDGRQYRAHRLAFFYMTGRWPDPEADHDDADTLNNRWANLREATKSQNGQNKGRMPGNTSGFKGVTFVAWRGVYQAQIRIAPGKRLWLGYFKTAEAAHAAYVAAAQEHHREFARVA
jgi:hypothetical protein